MPVKERSEPTEPRKGGGPADPAGPAELPPDLPPELPPLASPRHRVGSALAFRRDQLGFLARGIEEHGDLFRFRPLGIPMVLINHPDHIQHVLVEHSERYDKGAALFKIVRPVLRDGLIAIADMDRWRRQRRMMAPHFTPRTVATFARNMTDETELMLERWTSRPEPYARPLDVTDEIGQLALRIVTRSLFSAQVGDSARDFEQAFGAANAILADFFRFPFPPLSVPTPSHRVLRRAVDDMDSFVSGFIERRLADGPPGEADAEEEAPDLLTLLMHTVDDDGSGMDLEQLHHEVLNLCIGAYETTTNALSWAFYLLARHPEAEARVHAEVDEVLDDGRVPGFDDLPRFPYTRRVIDETLRIYSPAYQTMRRALVDDEIGGHRIPAHSNVLINSYFLHRHPDFWPAPDTFDPDNFAPEAVAARPKHAYVPFGSGPRVCIGKHFALTELVLALTTVARRHRLVLPDGAPEVEPDPLITLHPKGGVHLRLEPR
ncbi:cytochrome P450 [Streptomyces albiaxialis]|uniref:Cytochrome P450 n=1 Tax=Streptomyces albiaxialis TaxID=329523 RepID=A0ABP5HU51_9ACTN